MVMPDDTKAMLEPYFSQTVSLEGKLRAGVFCDSRSSDWECASIIILTEGFFENDEEVKVSKKYGDFIICESIFPCVCGVALWVVSICLAVTQNHL